MCEENLTVYFSKTVNVHDTLVTMCVGEVQAVDHNLFSAISSFIEGERRLSRLPKTRSMARCNQCRKVVTVMEFFYGVAGKP